MTLYLSDSCDGCCSARPHFLSVCDPANLEELCGPGRSPAQFHENLICRTSDLHRLQEAKYELVFFCRNPINEKRPTMGTISFEWFSTAAYNFFKSEIRGSQIVFSFGPRLFLGVHDGLPGAVPPGPHDVVGIATAAAVPPVVGADAHLVHGPVARL